MTTLTICTSYVRRMIDFCSDRVIRIPPPLLEGSKSSRVVSTLKPIPGFGLGVNKRSKSHTLFTSPGYVVQTLGHLGQMLQWPRFGHMRDTHEVLLAEADETYMFIEKVSQLGLPRGSSCVQYD
jgi:hypothetical protein